MEIAAELVHELDADGKQLRVVKLTDYTAEKVRTLCASPDELRARWADAGQRADIIQQLAERGIQAIALLDSTAEIATGQSASLSSILESIIWQNFSKSEHDEALHAVSSFITTVRNDRKRAEYIAQLADGAFNYFSLTVAPEVSEKLRGNPSLAFLYAALASTTAMGKSRV